MGEPAERIAQDVAGEVRELRATVERLEKTVTRFVVACERMLAANDASSQRARDALSKLHPEMARIQAEVAAKHRRMKR